MRSAEPQRFMMTRLQRRRQVQQRQVEITVCQRTLKTLQSPKKTRRIVVYPSPIGTDSTSEDVIGLFP